MRPGEFLELPGPATGKVTVWTWQDGVGVKALEDVTSAFNASQTDVQVESCGAWPPIPLPSSS